MFDIKEFQSVVSEKTLDEKFNLHPEGEFTGQIPVDPDRALNSISGENVDKDGKPKQWAQLTIRIDTLDPSGEIEKAIGRKPSVTDRFFLDLTPEGSFDYNPQRNIRTGQYLAAVGENKPNWSFSKLLGKQIKFKVVHVKSDLDPSQKVAKVTTLGRAQ